MIITRKIKIYVSEEDKDKKKELIHTLFQWRNEVRKAANIIVAHKFVQQNIRDFVYVTDEIKDKFYVKDILKDEKGMSEQNTTYRICAKFLKGKVPADIYSCLNQAVSKTFKETVSDINMGKSSLRSYRNDMPIPFSSSSVRNLHYDSENKRFVFDLFKIPFACFLGRDRSNNESVLKRCISGEYKLCSSAIRIEDKDMFLLLCFDIPKKEVKLEDGKELYAFLGVNNPIVYTVDVRAKQEFDSGLKCFEIGTAEEFNHRRRQIQEAVKRCQINNRYSTGGKGRKRKTQAIDRYHDKEKNYVDTKLHTYSRMLVDAAVKYKCSKIILMKQKQREDKAKDDNQNGDNLVLRNWSYFGLKTKIAYKAEMAGIKILEE